MKHEHGHGTPTSGERHSQHSFDDPSAFAQQLDAPERDAWQKPEDVIASFQLSDDATVARSAQAPAILSSGLPGT